MIDRRNLTWRSQRRNIVWLGMSLTARATDMMRLREDYPYQCVVGPSILTLCAKGILVRETSPQEGWEGVGNNKLEMDEESYERDAKRRRVPFNSRAEQLCENDKFVV